MWQRLCAEHGVEVSERQVRRYARERRLLLGEPVDEVFVPLCREPGVEATPTTDPTAMRSLCFA